ncbi:MAG TPA: diacylglycerol kinase family protein [Solirubrobacteraceae bacterium]
MSRALLIANPTSGGGKVLKLLPAVQERLRALGVEPRLELTRSLEHAGELARAALAAGELPVSFSGDGVAGAVAAAAAATEGAIVGVLPGGSGNDFCRHVGIPQDALEACAVIAHGTPMPIDLGEANGAPFLGIASLGFDSEANALANRAPRRLGRGIYVYGALGAVARWAPAHFDVSVDGKREHFDGWSVIVANTSVYGGGMYVAPDARVDDGLLDVVLIRKTSRLRFLASFPRVFKGTHVREHNVTVLRGREVTVAASRPFDVYADGDPIAEVPVTIRSLPAAVRVLLPAGA